MLARYLCYLQGGRLFCLSDYRVGWDFKDMNGFIYVACHDEFLENSILLGYFMTIEIDSFSSFHLLLVLAMVFLSWLGLKCWKCLASIFEFKKKKRS